MSSSAPSPIAAAKARHSLAEVAQRTGIVLPANRSGSVTVRCPMPAHGHPDRSPSLRLHLDAGVWFCFGCSSRKADGNPRGSDIIDWVCASEGVDWRSAIRILDSDSALTNAWAATDDLSHAGGHAAAGSGVGERPDLWRTPPERVQQALDAAWAYYCAPPLHRRGSDYLGSRGIDVSTLEAYMARPEVGHTPTGGRSLVVHLSRVGFSEDELVDAGLAYRRPGGGRILDYYRDRVLIPVRAANGRLVGLIGRNVGDPRWAKYKNPPRTHLYDKSVTLYQSLPVPARDGQVVVVEGTLDAMAIAVAAIQVGRAEHYCPVTQSGRELSPAQLSTVLAVHPASVVIAFDGDPPGLDSNVRTVFAAAELGRETMITLLPDGHDPASWLALHGPGGLGAWTPGSLAGRVRPVVPGGVVARHLWSQQRLEADQRGQPFDRTGSLERLISVVVGPARQLPVPAARWWLVTAGEAIGHMAVAEARQHLDDESPSVAARRINAWRLRLPSSARDAFARGVSVGLQAAPIGWASRLTPLVRPAYESMSTTGPAPNSGRYPTATPGL